MTNTDSPTKFTPVPFDEDTAARVALACAGVAGEVPVAIAIKAADGAARFVAAVHDGTDGALPLSRLTRQRIRTLATGRRVAAVLNRTQQLSLQVIAPHHELWPQQLAVMGHGAPLVLWVRGDACVLDGFSVAVTGTASPTGFGVAMVRQLARDLTGLGYAIGAGAGSGIDRLALEQTIPGRRRAFAVSAADISRTRVPEHVTVVSELPPGLPVTIRSQLRTKPLLAALAGKTVVVEAASGSAAVRTAQAAHGMGRPVGVLPGPIDSSASLGCRDLLRDLDVTPVTSALQIDWLR